VIETIGPAVTGFRLRVGHPGMPGDVGGSGLATRGDTVPVFAAPSPEWHWRGWTVGANTHHAATPVVTADGVTVLLAGELYHADALRSAIGDTAAGITDDALLLIAGWQRYGSAVFRLLNGRYAAVLTTGDRLVLATDHAASVPLYVCRHDGWVEIATEAKALAGNSHPRAEPLPGTEPVVALAGVRRVVAGAVVGLAAGSGHAAGGRTWRPPVHRALLPAQDAVQRVRVVLDAAVRTRLRGPVTAVLSGGVDSSSVVALAARAGSTPETISMGTDVADEFAPARVVADHIGTRHVELRLSWDDLVRQLPWVVAAAEIPDADVLEYLLPLVVLYRRLPGGPRRILTGYGADIPLGGMHRDAVPLDVVDDAIALDMDTFDGLNELSPVLGGASGHWTTHPFWDRDVLDVLTAAEPGLKRRHGRDKWLLREAVSDLLPASTVGRAKLGIHEGAGVTSGWTALLTEAGVPAADVPAVKRAMAVWLHRRVVGLAEPPDSVSFDDALRHVFDRGVLEVHR